MFIVREQGEIKNKEKWRADYAAYAVALTERFPPGENSSDLDPDSVTDPATLAQDPTAQGYPTAEHRRKVEKKAEAFARRLFREEYEIGEVMSQNRGYDFHMTRRDGAGEVLLEIKGTSGSEAAFFLTANEMRCLEANPENYQILLVTEALSNSPQGMITTPDDLGTSFGMQPLAWRVRPIAGAAVTSA